MKKTLITLALIGVAATAFAGIPNTDQDFVTEAAQGGLAEVALGKLASEKGSSTAVKKFGRQMVSDHGKANGELGRAAAKEKAAVPSSPSDKQQALLEKLKSMNGSEFDSTYADAMVKDHRTTIALFEKQAAAAEESPVRKFAAKTLPTLKHHLQMAEDMQKQTK